MKIIHVAWSLAYGGAETLLVQLVNRQCVSHNVNLILVNDLIEENLIRQIDKRVKIHTIKRPLHSRNPFYFCKLSILLLFLKSDIIHFQQDNLIEYIPIRFFKKNLCLTVHCVTMDIKSLSKYNHLFSISHSVQQEVRQKCRLESTLIYNGIDISLFKKKDEWLIKKNNWKFIQIGRLVHMHKGQHLLIQAADKLIKTHYFTDFTIHFFGEGPSKKYLEDLVHELKLDAFIKFEGTQSFDYIRKNLCKYDLLIQPSLYEGFGLTAIESMAAKVPVLASDVDGLAEIIQQNKYGYSFEQDNIEDLSVMMWKFIHEPQDKLVKLTSKSYQYAMDNFDISVTSDNYLNAYRNILHT